MISANSSYSFCLSNLISTEVRSLGKVYTMILIVDDVFNSSLSVAFCF